MPRSRTSVTTCILTVRAHLAQASRAVLAICGRSGRHGPTIPPAELLATLGERYRMTKTVEMLLAAPGLREALGRSPEDHL